VFVISGKIVGDTTLTAMKVRPAQILGTNLGMWKNWEMVNNGFTFCADYLFSCGRFYQWRAGQKYGAIALHNYRLVAHCWHISTAGSAGSVKI
jgi:hypothetical protein